MTNPQNAHDVVVVGGGPAGAAAARFLSMWGHSVLLIARAPGRNSLAESLPPSCVKLFDQLGVRDEIDKARFVRATGNTVHWGGNTERVEQFGANALGYQIVREAFDALLVRSAARAGAVVKSGSTASVLKREGGEWTVGYETAGAGETVRARWVLDCSGRAGVVARDGWRRARQAARTMALVGEWTRGREGEWDLPDATHTLVESYADGWAWSVPVGAGRRYFTVMVDPALTSVGGRHDLDRAYRAELDRTIRIRSLLVGGTLCGEPWARDASPYTTERFGENGTLLVGDAASFIDPLSSYGVKKALASAWLASVVVRTCLRNESLLVPALELYEGRERTMFHALQRQTAELSREAAGAHASDFWRDRTQWDEGASGGEGEGDVGALRVDPLVLSAFDELKRRDSVRFRPGDSVKRIAKPTVRGNEIVLLDHLFSSHFPAPIRYLRGIDLVLLSRLATDSSDVADLFDAYNRAAPPAPLPDFLGALSVLVGTEMLVFA